MQAVHQAGWGGREQLSVREMPRPSPGKGFVLVRVKAVSVHAGDHHMLTGRPYLIRAAVGRREIPGMDFSGVVEALGSNVEQFSLGDSVFGTADVACGAFAEFACVPAKCVVKKPENVDWEAAAAVPTSGQTALQALRIGPAVKPGDRVLVNGASGGVGSFAVQLAKSMGAHVTAVCSTANVELVRSLGADTVVDYRKESVEAAAARMAEEEVRTEDAGGPAGGVKYDKIIDAAGRPGWRPLLKPHGAYVAVALPYPESECVPCVLCSVLCSPWCFCCLSSKTSHVFMQSVSQADLEELAVMLGEGKLRATVGRRLVGMSGLPDALAEHSATIGLGHSQGKTVAFFGESESAPQLEPIDRGD